MKHTHFSYSDFSQFCDWIRQEYGIDYSADKAVLVKNRLAPLLEKFSVKSINQIKKRAKNDDVFRKELLNVLTTNETWFFRHPEHFKVLKKHILPLLIKSKKRLNDNRITVWSAGCSNGAELFSILISLYESINDLNNYVISLIGSDISSHAVKLARNGCFTQNELRTVPDEILDKYFSNETDNLFFIKPEFQKYVQFEVLNLLSVWPERRFDIIFCRNTMIYFDRKTKIDLTKKFYKSLDDNGYFFISSAESLHSDQDDTFSHLSFGDVTVYCKAQKITKDYIISFEKSSELLKAINLLNNHSIPFELIKVKMQTPQSPTRALLISLEDVQIVKEILRGFSIK